MKHLEILVIPFVLASSFCMWGEESRVILSTGCRCTVDFYRDIWCFFPNNSLYIAWLLTVMTELMLQEILMTAQRACSLKLPGGLVHHCAHLGVIFPWLHNLTFNNNLFHTILSLFNLKILQISVLVFKW